MAAVLLGVALAAGAFSRGHPPSVRMVGPYRVLRADFHVHAFPLSWATLAPWDMVYVTRRQGLDAITLAGHNHLWTSKLGRWFALWSGGPVVLPGEEIIGNGHHIIAAGIRTAVSRRLPADQQIREVHRQGGVAIAAHPVAHYWPGYRGEPARLLDGAEICHPVVYEGGYGDLQSFFEWRAFTAIGSSDQRGLLSAHTCMTYVFVREANEQGVLEAVRAGRTVVFGPDGEAFGDPALRALIHPESESETASSWGRFSAIAGVAALLLGILGPGGPRRKKRAHPAPLSHD